MKIVQVHQSTRQISHVFLRQRLSRSAHNEEVLTIQTFYVKLKDETYRYFINILQKKNVNGKI